MAKGSSPLALSPSPQLEETKSKFKVDLDVKIVPHTVNSKELEEFIKSRGKDGSTPSLKEYIQNKYYKDKTVVAVPKFNNGEPIEALDLSNLDFTGCNLHGASF